MSYPNDPNACGAPKGVYACGLHAGHDGWHREVHPVGMSHMAATSWAPDKPPNPQVSTSQDTRVGAAYTYTPLSAPQVRRVTGHPGDYVFDLGGGLHIHATAKEWDAITEAGRAGIAELNTAVAS